MCGGGGGCSGEETDQERLEEGFEAGERGKKRTGVRRRRFGMWRGKSPRLPKPGRNGAAGKEGETRKGSAKREGGEETRTAVSSKKDGRDLGTGIHAEGDSDGI